MQLNVFPILPLGRESNEKENRYSTIYGLCWAKIQPIIVANVTYDWSNIMVVFSDWLKAEFIIFI